MAPMLKFSQALFNNISLSLCTTISKFSSVAFNDENIYECSSEKTFQVALGDMKIIENFVSVKEEELLLKDIEPKFKRVKYQKGHWDNAIQNYRETESVRWSKDSISLISRMKAAAFKSQDLDKSSVHVLDLSASGVIMPHVDSIKFCGRVICGLSLLSPCVMKFVDNDNSNIWFKVHLKQRSLYIMKDKVRYDFTHEVLSNSNSFINGSHIAKDRRISVLCRSESHFQQSEDSNLFKSEVVPLD